MTPELMMLMDRLGMCGHFNKNLRKKSKTKIQQIQNRKRFKRRKR